MKLLFASNNRHKTEEIKNIIFENFNDKIEIVSPSSILINFNEPFENGLTFKENSLIKAKEYYKLSYLTCIADDSGLEIDSINGMPGVHSARFAGEPSDDAQNRTKVLEMMKNIEDEKRTARFKTVLCYFNKDTELYFEGICNGKITEYEMGTNGFGYDSIFIPEGYDITFAQMVQSKKNKISHRSIALDKFMKYLDSKI